MRGLARALLITGALATGTARAAAEAPDAWVVTAISAYTEALQSEDQDRRVAGFRRAEHRFRRAIEAGARNADLYANLGNAALQAERLGEAVLAYRRALLLDADHPRAAQNLAYARTLLPDWVPRPAAEGVWDRVFFWRRGFDPIQRQPLAAACFALAAFALAVSTRTGRPGWRAAALFPALLWLAMVGSDVVEALHHAPPAAVVTADEVVARAADASVAPRAFPEPLPAGTELQVVEERLPWVRVRLGQGREAWVRASAITRVDDAIPKRADGGRGAVDEPPSG